jgi:multicomponent Na+:H+ antiporter subunit C
MSQAHLFALSGVALVGIGLLGILVNRNLVRRTIGLNVCSSGVFLVIVGLAARGAPADPVPHALVLTGLVVGVSSTALSLALAVRLHRETGRAAVPDEHVPLTPSLSPRSRGEGEPGPSAGGERDP